VVTLHRPSNVDDPRRLRELVNALREVAAKVPLIWPVHPRVRTRLARENVAWLAPREPMPSSGLVCVDPLGYLDFVGLVSRASLVMTDSGGVQEETTMLAVPCLTLRESTERPVTVTHGTNRVIGIAPRRIVEEAIRTLEHPPVPLAPPPLWDGYAAARIVDVLLGVAIEAAA
jgi:UDP-N-acetylglucosamine 2-epimerase (non-hydrolysing)